MSDAALRSLGRSGEASDKRNVSLIRHGLAAEIGAEWASTLNRIDKLHVAAWADFEAHPTMVPEVTDPLTLELAAVLDRIESDDCWAEVSQAAACAARTQAKLDWAGIVHHAHAALDCDRTKTRQALDLNRMPSSFVVKGESVPLRLFEIRQFSRRCEQGARDEDTDDLGFGEDMLKLRLKIRNDDEDLRRTGEGLKAFLARR